jgi:hypothetical protein
MELKLQDKDRELRALQIDNEAVCFKILVMDFLICSYHFLCKLIFFFHFSLLGRLGLKRIFLGNRTRSSQHSGACHAFCIYFVQ